jgi:hypothetical protein
MSLTGILGGISAVGSAAGGIGSLINSFGGGGGGGTSRAQNDLIRDTAEAAAQNVKLTSAQQNYALGLGALFGSLGLEASQLSSGQLTQLASAANDLKARTNTQASEISSLFTAGNRLASQLASSRIGVELLGPQFLSQAGAAALSGENQLARGLASTNLGIRQTQEAAAGNAALDQANTYGDVFSNRAATEGLLARGAQTLESNLRLTEARTLGDLAKINANTKSQLAQIQAQTKAQLAMKRFGATQALTGLRALA